jgi:predicted nucleotidyltransferase
MNVTERRLYQPEELQERLKPVLEDIRAVYEPERVILFGSAAQGIPWHDLDLLVVAETEDRFPDRLKKIALAKTYWTVSDILVLTPAELQEAIEENGVFVVEEVLNKGKVVYERSRPGHMAPVRPR